MKAICKVGDIFEIPLKDERKAFGQFLFLSKKGPIIQIFDLVSKRSIAVDEIITKGLLFPPVITGLYAALKDGIWKVVDNVPVINFVHPLFVSTLWNEKTGEAGIWFLWDGQKDNRIGSFLPEKYRSLEFLVVWNPKDIERRIETREVPYPYGDLIKKNRFTPRAKPG